MAKYVWGQFGKPNGLFGQIIGRKMAKGNVHDARWTVSLLGIEPQHRVLDIGFGPGASTQLAAESATDGFVAGVDHSMAMVRQARK